MVADPAVIWTRTPHPHKLADLTLARSAIIPSAPLGLTQSPAPSPIPPQLAALIPPRNPRNIQRQLVQRSLDRAGIELRGRPALEQDWLTLRHCGRNGLGHLDVFATDADAARCYAQAPTTAPDWSLIPLLTRLVRHQATPAELDALLDALGGPPAGIPGAQPKVLLGDWLVKLDNPAYPGLLQLEDLAYEYHRRAGFETPESRYLEIEGVPVLASRRFDRVGGQAVPMESMYSSWATREPGRYWCNTDGSMEQMADALREYGVPVLEWFGRFVLAILTGNGDVHSENVSLVERDGQVQLSPVYDPAPMRAYRGRSNHDLLSALPFAGIGGTTSSGYRPYADSGDTPPDLRERLVQLGVYAGIDAAVAEGEIDRLVRVSEGYAESVMAHLMLTLPDGYVGRAPDVRGFAETLERVREAVRG